VKFKKPDCLVICEDAHELAQEIERLAGSLVSIKVCASVDDARSEYTNESVLLGNPKMIAQILPEMPTVDWVQSSWAGVTPLMSLDRRDYVLTGIKGVLGAQISEYVFAYLLSHELKLNQRMDEQRQRHWYEAFSGSLQAKRLCIMGTGTIGQHIAKTAKSFGITVTGLSRSGDPAPGYEKVSQVGQLNEFLQDLDYLVATLPQTADTNGLLNATSLAELPAHAYFINVGRSNVVDDAALIDALKNHKLAGAAVDVFDEEPIPQDSPLWETPQLSITAHIAAVSVPSLIAPIFLENYNRYIDQQPLNYLIDFDTGY